MLLERCINKGWLHSKESGTFAIENYSGERIIMNINNFHGIGMVYSHSWLWRRKDHSLDIKERVIMLFKRGLSYRKNAQVLKISPSSCCKTWKVNVFDESYVRNSTSMVIEQPENHFYPNLCVAGCWNLQKGLKMRRFPWKIGQKFFSLMKHDTSVLPTGIYSETARYKLPTTICIENCQASNFHYDMGLYQQKWS